LHLLSSSSGIKDIEQLKLCFFTNAAQLYISAEFFYHSYGAADKQLLWVLWHIYLLQYLVYPLFSFVIAEVTIVPDFAKAWRQNMLFYNQRINKIETQKVGVLSIGEQRFLQFLLLLNLDHYFLLLDEPFSMVEPLYKDLIKEKIEEYKHHKGFIITDHYYLDVLQVSTIKKVIKNGAMKTIINDTDLIDSGYLSDRLRR